jgi:hypothetical protein
VLSPISQESVRESGHRTGKFGRLRPFSCAWPHDASAAATANSTRRKKVLRPRTVTANMFGRGSAPTKQCAEGPTAPSNHRTPQTYVAH